MTITLLQLGKEASQLPSLTHGQLIQCRRIGLYFKGKHRALRVVALADQLMMHQRSSQENPGEIGCRNRSNAHGHTAQWFTQHSHPRQFVSA